MSMTAAQVVALANQIAKTPGFTSQAGQILNAILQEIADTRQFDSAQSFTTFNFNPGLVATGTPGAQVTPGSGPYPLPAGFLRANLGDVFWTLLGVPYQLIPIEMAEFDATVQQAGLQSYPTWYAVDMSTSPPGMFVWPPPSGSFPVFVRYYGREADIATPETSTAVPWFDHDTYLYTRLAGEMMKVADDARWQQFLGDAPGGAEFIMRQLQAVRDNTTNRSAKIKLDRRRFGPAFDRLPNTKVVGW